MSGDERIDGKEIATFTSQRLINRLYDHEWYDVHCHLKDGREVKGNWFVAGMWDSTLTIREVINGATDAE